MRSRAGRGSGRAWLEGTMTAWRERRPAEHSVVAFRLKLGRRNA